MRRRILSLAIPNIITNITVPLVGIADLAIAGRLSDSSSVAAVVIGSTIFNFLYWNFGFLRMGTSGFASQSYGARNFLDSSRVLLRSLSVAIILSLLILLLMHPISSFALMLIDGSNHVEDLAMAYFSTRIIGAPAVLSIYAFKGWFIGMQNSKTPMWMAIIINIVNILSSIFFAFHLDMGISGIGLGSAIGQWSGVLFALIMLDLNYKKIFSADSFKNLFDLTPMKRFFRVNSDIFIRTLCLVAVFSYITIASSSRGDEMIAANGLLLQLFSLFSYMMDGFAYAAEALSGRYYGARDIKMLRSAVFRSVEWGVYLSLLITIVYFIFCADILMVFNPSCDVINLSLQYKWYVIAVPLCSFLAFVYDGILVGITSSRIMRNVMLVSTSVFFTVYFLFRDSYGNDALWCAFLLYLFLRGALQLLFSVKQFSVSSSTFSG